MIKFFAILVIVSVVLYLVNYALSFVDKYGKLDYLHNLDFYLDAYMRGGFDKTRWRLRDPTTGRRLWFIKLTSVVYGRNYGLTRFFLKLTPDGCSPDEFNRAKQALTEAGIEYYLTTERDPSPRALVVHCDMDVDKAVRVARCILVDVFGLSDNSPLRYGLYGPAKSSPRAMVGWEDSPLLVPYLRKRAAAGKPIPKRYMHLVGGTEG